MSIPTLAITEADEQIIQIEEKIVLVEEDITE